MNANELADRIEELAERGEAFCDEEEQTTIVTALRQYAALEWLWEQKPRGYGGPVFAQRLTLKAGYRAGLADSDTWSAYGPTVTAAINNLRAKLEPPHEHVWDDASWILCMGGGYVRACQSQSCMEIQRADRLVPA